MPRKAALGYTYVLIGDLAAAERFASEVLANLSSESPIGPRCAALNTLTLVREAEGRLRDQLDLCRQSLNVVEHDGRPLPMAGTIAVYLVFGRLCYQRNELDSAESFLRRALEVSQALKHPYAYLLAAAHLACVAQARGATAQANAWLNEAEQRLPHISIPYQRMHFEIHCIRVWLAQGQLEAAHRWAEAQAGSPCTSMRSIRLTRCP